MSEAAQIQTEPNAGAGSNSVIARDRQPPIGRIVSVTGSKSIVMLDDQVLKQKMFASNLPEMGTLLGIETQRTVVLGLISALSVPVPAQNEGDREVWIAEISLVGELAKDEKGEFSAFHRGVSNYPLLGDSVRIAGKEELRLAFCAEGDHAVEVGCITQDTSIPAMIKTDDLLGKHFAILGTTGTGKSCTTALIFRSILEKNPAAHILLLDPHNEYATSFGELAEVIRPSNMQLPYWLLTFEELVEVIIGDAKEQKQLVELLQELIPLCKNRYGANSRGDQNSRLRSRDFGHYTVDTPVPYRISDLVKLLDERMGMLENKKDLSPYRLLKTKIETITSDQRYAFMFGNRTVDDQMAEILGRFFRVPVDGRPITIVEMTGLPAGVVSVIVSVLSRMTFDFALWCEGRVPVTIVCEEAHRYVPVNASLGFEPCKRAIAKIAKEGRKYGASLCIITQRPAEIDPTILSQCNTVFALRMSNDRDQEIVTSAISDTGSGLLEFLPALGAREAIAFGDGVSLPVRIRFKELPKSALPRSSTAKFSEKWQSSEDGIELLNMIVDRWRNFGCEIDESNDAIQADDTPIINAARSTNPTRRFGDTSDEAMAQRRPGQGRRASDRLPQQAGNQETAPNRGNRAAPAETQLQPNREQQQPSPQSVRLQRSPSPDQAQRAHVEQQHTQTGERRLLRRAPITPDSDSGSAESGTNRSSLRKGDLAKIIRATQDR